LLVYDPFLSRSPLLRLVLFMFKGILPRPLYNYNRVYDTHSTYLFCLFNFAFFVFRSYLSRGGYATRIIL
jgi:hypothetical protein